MRLPRVLSVFGWLLVAASVATLLAALFLSSGIFEAMKQAVPAGVLLALAGHLFTQAKARHDIEDKTSQFSLDGMRLAFLHAKTLLEGGSNSRSTWIEAARAIAHGLELAKGVTAEAHRRVLEVEQLKYRGIFHGVLASKAAAFFYGVQPTFATLDEAAMASTAPRQVDGRHLASANDALAEESVRTVWLAAQWPKDYDDPVGEKFEEREVSQLMLFYPQLHTYLEHRRSWHSAAGNLHPVKRG